MIKSQRFIISAIIFLLIIGLLFVINKPNIVSEEFIGTYEAGTGPTVVYFSVDKDGDFFYTDQNNQVYIKGKVFQITEDIYEIISDSLKMQNVIKPQEIHYKDKSFQLMLSGEKKKFEKIEEVPIVFYNSVKYE